MRPMSFPNGEASCSRSMSRILRGVSVLLFKVPLCCDASYYWTLPGFDTSVFSLTKPLVNKLLGLYNIVKSWLAWRGFVTGNFSTTLIVCKKETRQRTERVTRARGRLSMSSCLLFAFLFSALEAIEMV